MKKIIRIFLMLIINMPWSLYAQDIYYMTVATDGSGDYKSIQKAIDACKAFPDKRITIHIKNGIYNEKVVVPSCNNLISFIGEDPGKTIITYGDYFNKVDRGRNSTFYTYTLLIEADDFHAENITVMNSAGPVGQAVALHVIGDRCTFTNCHIVGNQDTLYTSGAYSRQYYKNCYIEGTTDFIFGSATALFEECTICSKADSYVTAASTDKGKRFGFVFLNCKLIASPGVLKVYLGRPWRDYAKVAFIRCDLGSHIQPSGWSNWSGTTRDKTAFYAEYKNNGPGANNQMRVSWSHQLSDMEAAEYTIEKILAPQIQSEKPVKQWITGN